jgi:hypothetical protein
MSDSGTERRRSNFTPFAILIILALLICVCAASPTLAASLPFFQPVSDFTQPIVCRVPQFAAVAVVCPNGEKGGFCGQPCSPDDAKSCGGFEDVTCQKDETGKYACGGPGCVPTTDIPGGCFDPCDPQDPNACGEGLSCGQYGSPTAGIYACVGDVCTQPSCGCEGTSYVCKYPDGKVETTENSTACTSTPDCQCDGTTLVCKYPDGSVKSTEGADVCQGECRCDGTDYVCVKPDGSKTTSYNSQQCGGEGGCACRGTTLVCSDGTYAEFNPQCGVGGDTGGEGCTCIANPACQAAAACRSPYICKETGQACTPPTTP